MKVKVLADGQRKEELRTNLEEGERAQPGVQYLVDAVSLHRDRVEEDVVVEHRMDIEPDGLADRVEEEEVVDQRDGGDRLQLLEEDGEDADKVVPKCHRRDVHDGGSRDNNLLRRAKKKKKEREIIHRH